MHTGHIVKPFDKIRVTMVFEIPEDGNTKNQDTKDPIGPGCVFQWIDRGLGWKPLLFVQVLTHWGGNKPLRSHIFQVYNFLNGESEKFEVGDVFGKKYTLTVESLFREKGGSHVVTLSYGDKRHVTTKFVNDKTVFDEDKSEVKLKFGSYAMGGREQHSLVRIFSINIQAIGHSRALGDINNNNIDTNTQSNAADPVIVVVAVVLVVAVVGIVIAIVVVRNKFSNSNKKHEIV